MKFSPFLIGGVGALAYLIFGKKKEGDVIANVVQKPWSEMDRTEKYLTDPQRYYAEKQAEDAAARDTGPIGGGIADLDVDEKMDEYEADEILRKRYLLDLMGLYYESENDYALCFDDYGENLYSFKTGQTLYPYIQTEDYASYPIDDVIGPEEPLYF